VAGGFGSAPDYRDGELPLMVQAEPIFQHCLDVCVYNEKNLYIFQWNAAKSSPIKLLKGKAQRRK